MFKNRPYQDDAVNDCMNYINGKSKKPSVCVAPVGCHTEGFEILMYDGSLKEVQDISIGEELMGIDSTKRVVKTLHRGEDQLYKITVRNGVEFTVNEGHILKLYRTSYPDKLENHKGVPHSLEVTILEYLNLKEYIKQDMKLRISDLITFETNNILPISPYFLGLWLGDGTSSKPHITTKDVEVVNYLKEFSEKNNLNLVKQNTPYGYSLTRKIGTARENNLTKRLRFLGVIGNKHIPHIYKTASVEDRVMLLTGLLDSDGYLDRKKGVFELTQKSKKLVEDIKFLCHSLGLYCTLKKSYKNCQSFNKKRLYYRLHIKWSPLLVKNKIKRKKLLEHKHNTRSNLFKFDITKMSRGKYYGFSIDKDSLYLCSNFFIHHNSGKSLIIAQVANQIESPVLVMQPSVELLKQNISKLEAYGGKATIYSASAGTKEMSDMTYATLGSVKKLGKEFKARGVKHVLIDEADRSYSPERGSMFKTFMNTLKPEKVIGFTATPIRLKTIGGINDSHSQLCFLNRMRPKYFSDIIHVTQVSTMVENNYWTPINYEEYDFDESTLRLNTTGSEYTEASISKAVAEQDINNTIYLRLKSLLREGRTGILVFVDSVENAKTMARALGKDAACVYGDMNKKDRKSILERFIAGDIKVVVNYSVLGIGFDFPKLSTVVLGRPTNSFSLFYQFCGRVVRIHPDKEKAHVIDFGGNIKRFARIEGITIENYKGHGWGIFSQEGRLLTNYPMGFDPYYKSDIDAKYQRKMIQATQQRENPKMWFGKYSGKYMKDVPLGYFKWLTESGFNFEENENTLIMKEHIAQRLEDAIT